MLSNQQIDYAWSKARDHLEDSEWFGINPEIEINGISPIEYQAVFDYIMSKTSIWHNEKDYIWDNIEEREVKLSSIENPVDWIVSGRGQSVSFTLNPFNFNGVQMPDMGLFLLGESDLSIIYVLGPDWNREQLGAFLAFILTLSKIAPSATIRHEESQIMCKPFNDIWNHMTAASLE